MPATATKVVPVRKLSPLNNNPAGGGSPANGIAATPTAKAIIEAHSTTRKVSPIRNKNTVAAANAATATATIDSNSHKTPTAARTQRKARGGVTPANAAGLDADIDALFSQTSVVAAAGASQQKQSADQSSAASNALLSQTPCVMLKSQRGSANNSRRQSGRISGTVGAAVSAAVASIGGGANSDGSRSSRKKAAGDGGASASQQQQEGEAEDEEEDDALLGFLTQGSPMSPRIGQDRLVPVETVGEDEEEANNKQQQGTTTSYLKKKVSRLAHPEYMHFMTAQEVAEEEDPNAEMARIQQAREEALRDEHRRALLLRAATGVTGPINLASATTINTLQHASGAAFRAVVVPMPLGNNGTAGQPIVVRRAPNGTLQVQQRSHSSSAKQQRGGAATNSNSKKNAMKGSNNSGNGWNEAVVTADKSRVGWWARPVAGLQWMDVGPMIFDPCYPPNAAAHAAERLERRAARRGGGAQKRARGAEEEGDSNAECGIVNRGGRRRTSLITECMAPLQGRATVIVGFEGLEI